VETPGIDLSEFMGLIPGLEEKPKDATHWLTRSMAKEVDMSQITIWRIWNAFSLRLHRAESFKLSTDPLLVEKIRDIVGLYLDPPKSAVVLWSRRSRRSRRLRSSS